MRCRENGTRCNLAKLAAARRWACDIESAKHCNWSVHRFASVGTRPRSSRSVVPGLLAAEGHAPLGPRKSWTRLAARPATFRMTRSIGTSGEASNSVRIPPCRRDTEAEARWKGYRALHG